MSRWVTSNPDHFETFYESVKTAAAKGLRIRLTAEFLDDKDFDTNPLRDLGQRVEFGTE